MGILQLQCCHIPVSLPDLQKFRYSMDLWLPSQLLPAGTVSLQYCLSYLLHFCQMRLHRSDPVQTGVSLPLPDLSISCLWNLTSSQHLFRAICRISDHEDVLPYKLSVFPLRSGSHRWLLTSWSHPEILSMFQGIPSRLLFQTNLCCNKLRSVRIPSESHKFLLFQAPDNKRALPL